MRKQIANIITISRILSGIYLLFCPVFSIGFYIMYLFSGITDMIDGTINEVYHTRIGKEVY